MDLELPFPPSVNQLWRRFGHRTLLSRRGRAFRHSVQAILSARGVRPITGRLAVAIDVHPPDRRRRDLDNFLKALLDALQHGGAYHDDAQIDDLHIRRGARVPGGLVCVRLVPLPDPGPAGAGPGNRICPPCSRDNARLRPSEPEVQRQRGAKRRNGEALSPAALDGDVA